MFRRILQLFQRKMEARPSKVQKLLVIGEALNFKFEDNKKFDEEGRQMLEDSLQGLTIEEIIDFEKIFPFFEQIEGLLKSSSIEDEVANLKCIILDLMTKARQKVIRRNFPNRVAEAEREIQRCIIEVTTLLNNTKGIAKQAFGLLVHGYIDETGRQYDLDEKTIKNIQDQVWKGVGCAFAGIVAVGFGTYGLFAAFSSEAALAVTTVAASTVALIIGVTLLSMGACKAIKSYKQKKKITNIVKFYLTMIDLRAQGRL